MSRIPTFQPLFSTYINVVYFKTGGRASRTYFLQKTQFVEKVLEVCSFTGVFFNCSVTRLN